MLCLCYTFCIWADALRGQYIRPRQKTVENSKEIKGVSLAFGEEEVEEEQKIILISLQSREPISTFPEKLKSHLIDILGL